MHGTTYVLLVYHKEKGIFSGAKCVNPGEWTLRTGQEQWPTNAASCFRVVQPLSAKKVKLFFAIIIFTMSNKFVYGSRREEKKGSIT